MPTIRAVETNGAVTIEAVVTIDINSPQWMPGETAMLASIGSPRDKLGRALRIATGDALASLIDNAVVTTVARADEQATSDRETDNLIAARQFEEIKKQAVTIEELNLQVKQRNADFDHERNRANDLEAELNALKAAAKKRTRPASASKKPTAKSQQKPRPASR